MYIESTVYFFFLYFYYQSHVTSLYSKKKERERGQAIENHPRKKKYKNLTTVGSYQEGKEKSKSIAFQGYRMLLLRKMKLKKKIITT